MRICVVMVMVAMSGLLALSQSAAEEQPVDERALQEVQEVVKKIQGRYEKTKDLQASFTQKTKIEGFSTPVISTGRFYIKKPGHLRWDYIEPATEEIYVNKDDVKMYVPEHKQVLVGKLTYMAASQAPLQLLQGVAKLDEEFDIAPTANRERGAGGIPLLSLTPKDGRAEPERAIQRIVIEVQPKTYFLKTISLHEVSGNIATFEFSELKPNNGLKDDLFDFKTPPDVEVVRAPVLSRP
ncbi:MAG: Outer membrane lipoprotein carrier protein LolA [Nitrospira sp.]|nr:MAG: Outer membrane lipoprotein carrier protein LolA [Nitrospira sp.]